MTNFMFLSTNASDIAGYFLSSSGNTVSVDYVYNSIALNLDDLNNKNISVDKLIIVIYDNSQFNVKEEFGALSKLLESSVYFRVGEILLYTEDSEYCIEAQNTFRYIMENSRFTKYTVKTYKDVMSTIQIYKDVMNVVPPDVTKTTYNIVYRQEVDEDSKVGYSPKDYKGSLVPVEQDTSEVYESYKESTRKLESNNLIVEINPKEIAKVDFEIPKLSDASKLLKKFTVFTGLAKSGTSIVSSYTLFDSKNALLIDLSKNQGSKRIIDNLLDTDTNNIYPNVEYINNSEYLIGKTYDNEGLKLMCCDKYDFITTFLNFYITRMNTINCDNVLIDCDLEDFNLIIDIIGLRINKIVFTCESVKEEYNLLLPHMVNDVKADKYMFLNNYISLSAGYNPLPIKEISKDLKDYKIIIGENLLLGDYSLDVFI